MFHTGTSIFPGARNTYGDPIYVDDVAVDFPKMKILLAHGGRPLWMHTAFFLLRRHANVFLDISGIPPKSLLNYFPAPGRDRAQNSVRDRLARTGSAGDQDQSRRLPRIAFARGNAAGNLISNRVEDLARVARRLWALLNRAREPDYGFSVASSPAFSISSAIPCPPPMQAAAIP